MLMQIMLTLDKCFSMIFWVAKFHTTICYTQYLNMTILNKDSVDMNIKCDGMFITELIANLIQSQSLKKYWAVGKDTSKCIVFCFWTQIIL